MSEMQPFTFPATGQAVRTVDRGGEPWFVNADVCKILKHSDPSVALRMLDEDEKYTLHRSRRSDTPYFEHPSVDQRIQSLSLVSEAGLYALILRSNVPGARAFKRWVTHEVLPAIRRTGTYSVAQLSRRDLAQMVIAEADRADAAEQRVAELEPAADAWNVLADAKGDYSVREAAQILNRDPAISTGQKRLFAYLRHIGWIASDNQPYQAQIDNGRLVRRMHSYLDSNTGERVPTWQVRITVKGLYALRDRLGGQQTFIPIDGGAA